MVELFSNSGDPDQTPRSAASDLRLHCLPITLLGVSQLQWVNTFNPADQNVYLCKECGSRGITTSYLIRIYTLFFLLFLFLLFLKLLLNVCQNVYKIRLRIRKIVMEMFASRCCCHISKVQKEGGGRGCFCVFLIQSSFFGVFLFSKGSGFTEQFCCSLRILDTVLILFWGILRTEQGTRICVLVYIYAVYRSCRSCINLNRDMRNGVTGVCEQLTLKLPRKPASENIVCLCRLLNILANFSNLFLHTGKMCEPRSDLEEQSDLGPHC